MHGSYGSYGWYLSLLVLYMVHEIDALYFGRTMDTRLASGTLSERVVVSQSHCAQLCSREQACMAANYAHGTSTCELLDAAEGTESVEGGSLLLKKFVIVPGLVAFWPLNAIFEGRDMMTTATELRLHGVAFRHVPGWHAPLAFFTGLPSSFATAAGAQFAFATSFSWMAALYYEANNGPLLEMHLGTVHGYLIWINGGRFYARLQYPTCSALQLYYGDVPQHQWMTVAVTYDHDTTELALWIDGEKSATTGSCTEQLNHAGNPVISMGKRTAADDPRYIQGHVTCMSLYDRAMTYDAMYAATMPFCKT